MEVGGFMQHKQWHQLWFPDWVRFAASAFIATLIVVWRLGVVYDDLQKRLESLERANTIEVQSRTRIEQALDLLQQQNTAIFVVLHEKWPTDIPMPHLQSSDPPPNNASSSNLPTGRAGEKSAPINLSSGVGWSQKPVDRKERR